MILESGEMLSTNKRRCSSVMTLYVVYLMLSPLLLQRINGQNPVCFQFISGPFVDYNTITYELDTVQTESNGTTVWSNRLNASWSKPSDSYVGSYVIFVEVIPTTSSGALPDCVIGSSDVVVKETTYVKEGIPFGFDFKLTVQATNELSTIRNILSTTGVFFSTNDCYLRTMDADFCSSRPTETQYVGTVYDLRVDSVYPNVTNSNELLANVSWLPPLQVNPQYTLIGYHVNYIDAGESNSVILGLIPHNNNSRKDVRYSVNLEGLQMDEIYTLKIAAFVTKEGDKAEMGKSAAITIETPASVNVPTTVIHKGTQEIMTEPTHFQKTSTLPFSKAPNTIAPPQTSSNGGWMEENQTVVVAVIICASLLVVGSLAFACYIAQVKEEKVEQRNKMISVRKIGNEYIYN